MQLALNGAMAAPDVKAFERRGIVNLQPVQVTQDDPQPPRHPKMIFWCRIIPFDRKIP
jgi:hypothetical protein